VFIRRRLENYRNKNQNSLKLQGKKLKFAKITRAKNQNSLKLPEPNLKSINVKRKKNPSPFLIFYHVTTTIKELFSLSST
jgi:hypothetical protein